MAVMKTGETIGKLNAGNNHGARLHAGEFALGEGALHVALVAAELLGSLPELLSEFLRFVKSASWIGGSASRVGK